MHRHCASIDKKLIRVVVADDSAVVRELLRRVIDAEPDMIVVGMAVNGEETVRLVDKLKPDLVTMDVAMPRVDGVMATRRIMNTQPTPIAIVTAKPVGDDHETTFRAMAAGAVEVIAKPDYQVFEHDGEARAGFVRQLKNVARVGVVGIRGNSAGQALSEDERLTSRPPAVNPADTSSAALIALGASTGGPPCIREILGELRPDHCPPIVVTQHMSAQFIASFAQWLDVNIALPVEVARHGALLLPGRVYVAPGEQHLEVTEAASLRVLSSSPVRFQLPSVDVMFGSVARAYGHSAIAVLLTGMGTDGALGMKELRDAGALTIAQDEESSLVYGMPAAACELNAARLCANPKHIGRLLRRVRFSGGSTGKPQDALQDSARRKDR